GFVVDLVELAGQGGEVGLVGELCGSEVFAVGGEDAVAGVLQDALAVLNGLPGALDLIGSLAVGGEGGGEGREVRRGGVGLGAVDERANLASGAAPAAVVVAA